MSIVPKSYNTLRRSVAEILAEGRQRAEQAVEQEKVTTYWEVGKVLQEHLLDHRDRADYGGQVITRLASDMEISDRRLYEMLKFHRQFPILHAHAELGLTHYRMVLSLKNPVERGFYLDQTEKNGWSTRELKSQIRSGAYRRSLAEPERPSTPVPTRGRLYTYRIRALEGDAVVVDLGFSHERRLPRSSAQNLKPGDLVESTREGRSGFHLTSSGLDHQFRFTYKAEVLRIVDGDTLRVRAHLGFDSAVRHTLRLRGINTPEMSSPEGEEAKAFVEAALAEVDFVVARTYWRGRYGRYLADIFYLPGAENPQVVADEGVYLNRELVEKGLAVTA
jgi:endonuclease YncB( thermonuclease family)